MASARRTLASGSVVAALALTLSACSSSGNHSTASGSSTSAPSSGSSAGSGQPSGTPIKIGFLCSCSGLGGFGAFLVPGEDEYKAWANTVNASGGIDGHPVQLEVQDDAGNPGTSISAAQTLISDHVVAIADNTELDSTWASAAQAANIPVVGVLTSNTPFGTNPDFYPEGQTNDSAIFAVVTTAKAAGATDLANVYCAESPICAQSAPAFTATGKQLGVPVDYSAEISATAPNYTAQCVAAQQKGVKSVFLGDASAVILRFASDCVKQGYNPVWLQEGGGFGLNETSGPGLKDNLWMEFPGYPFFGTNPGVQAANAAMDKYFPGVRENQDIFEQDGFMAWTSAQLLEDAIKAGGLTASAAPSAAEVTSGLTSLKGDTVQGLAPPLTFQAGKPHTIDCWFTVRVQNGTPSLTNDGKTTCQPGT